MEIWVKNVYHIIITGKYRDEIWLGDFCFAYLFQKLLIKLINLLSFSVAYLLQELPNKVMNFSFFP